MIWQSILSVTPPCPGMVSPKSLILMARLNPDAKNPPKGAIKLTNRLMIMAWTWNSETQMVKSPMAKIGCELTYLGCIRPG